MKVAIVGPNPPIICKIVPKGCENGIIFKLVNTASPDQAIPVITNVIIRNFANRLVSNSVYLLFKLGFVLFFALIIFVLLQLNHIQNTTIQGLADTQ